MPYHPYAYTFGKFITQFSVNGQRMMTCRYGIKHGHLAPKSIQLQSNVQINPANLTTSLVNPDNPMHNRPNNPLYYTPYTIPYILPMYGGFLKWGYPQNHHPFLVSDFPLWTIQLLAVETPILLYTIHFNGISIKNEPFLDTPFMVTLYLYIYIYRYWNIYI